MKEKMIQYTLRLPAELKQQVKEKAGKEIRSFNNTIIYLLQKGLESEQKK